MADLVYRVCFAGVASATLRAAFDDCEIETGSGATTLWCAHGALRGVLGRIQDLGLELIEVTSSDEPTSNDSR